jgi:hypothetical protein
VTLGSGGNVTLGSGGNVTLGSGGNVTLCSGGTVTLGSGGNVTLGSGGTVTLGSGGNITLGSGGNITLGSGGNITLGSGGVTTNELTYDTANSIVRPPPSATYTQTSFGITVNWMAPSFGVVQTYTIYRGVNGLTPVVIGSVSGVTGNPPATTFTDANPPAGTLVYTITTTLVPDTGTSTQRQSLPSPPAVLTLDQTIVLGSLPSSVSISSASLPVTATAESNGNPNMQLVSFSATGPCSVGSPSINSANGVSSATVSINNIGSCAITASQTGNSNSSQSGGKSYNAADPVSGTFMILAQGSTLTSQTITFPQLPNVQYGGTFTLHATSSSGLTVSFTASGPCTTSGTTTGVGVCKITASAPATSTYSAASATQSFNIIPAVLTVTATSFSSPYGQAPPTLPYTLTGFVNSDPTTVVTGTPVLSTAATSTSNAGMYPITVLTGTLAAANYDFLFVNGTLTIQQTNQAPLTLITTSPLTYNHSETLSVTGGSTGGLVTYNLVPGPCTIVGNQLTATSGTGSCTLTATMAGNSNYSSVTSTPVNTVSLSPASQTIAFTTNPPMTAAFNTSFTVAATASSGIPVTFTPAGSCTNSGATYTMTNSTGNCSVIASQAGNTNYAPATPVTKTVSATGPLVTVSPSNINFGTVYQGSITTKNITVTNIGTAPLTVNQPLLSIVKGGNSNEFVAVNLCPKPLAAGKSCTITIAFVAGPFYTAQTATLEIMDNAPGSPQPVALSALVIDPLASFSPTSLSFGTVKHATSSTLNVTLSNPGGTPLIFSGAGINVTGANAKYFVESNNCGSSLAAGAKCSIGVKFTPPATGTFSANLTVVDNAQAGGGTQTVPLSGKGN